MTPAQHRAAVLRRANSKSWAAALHELAAEAIEHRAHADYPLAAVLEARSLVPALAGEELLDRGYGRPLQMIDASLMQKKLTELTPAELAALEARMLSAAAMDAADGEQPDLSRPAKAP